MCASPLSIQSMHRSFNILFNHDVDEIRGEAMQQIHMVDHTKPKYWLNVFSSNESFLMLKIISIFINLFLFIRFN